MCVCVCCVVAGAYGCGMRRCWGDCSGSRTRRLVCLLFLVSLVTVLVLLTSLKLTFLPQRILSPFAAHSPTTPAASSDGSSTPSTAVIHGETTTPANWGRQATFVVVLGGPEDAQHDVVAMLPPAETAGDCRSLSTTNATSGSCRRPDDVYILYGADKELRAVQAALSANRYRRC